MDWTEEWSALHGRGVIRMEWGREAMDGGMGRNGKP